MNIDQATKEAAKHLDDLALIKYEVLKSGVNGIVSVCGKYLDKHPELKNDPEWVKREADGYALWHEVDTCYSTIANAKDPIAAMQPYFDRTAALRIEGETY